MHFSHLLSMKEGDHHRLAVAQTTAKYLQPTHSWADRIISSSEKLPVGSVQSSAFRENDLRWPPGSLLPCGGSYNAWVLLIFVYPQYVAKKLQLTRFDCYH